MRKAKKEHLQVEDYEEGEERTESRLEKRRDDVGAGVESYEYYGDQMDSEENEGRGPQYAK